MSAQKFEDRFRSAHELWSSGAWLFSAAVLLLYRPPYWPLMILAALALSVLRLRDVKRLYAFRSSLSLSRLRTIKLNDLLIRSRRLRKEREILSLGRGFDWSQRHVETARQVLNRNADELPDVPEIIKRQAARLERIPKHERTAVDKAVAVFLKGILPENTRPILDSDIGEPWIHGLGIAEEKDVGIPLSALPGHTLITGTTRAGKTRLFEAVTAQIIDMGSALIVIDPKKDIDWVSMLNTMCLKTGRKFLYFDPAQPHKSIRLQPLQNWNNISEPATRIGQLVDADGSFAAFAWKTLYRVHRALIAAGERPTIRNTKRYVQMGVEGLAEKLLQSHFAKKHGPDWDRDLRSLPTTGKQAMSRLDWCILKYIDEGDTDDTIDGIISMVRHSKEHYSKMVQVLEPILEMLGSD